jgi:hypothetical protein
LIAVVLASCGGSYGAQKLYSARVKVLFLDGKPMTERRVVFVSTEPSITVAANVDGDGGFAFKAASGDGLPEAEYKVRIEAVASGGAKVPGGK